MPVRIKICGITNLDDAVLCADFGADALGFVFYSRSPRYLIPEEAAKIISSLPPFINTVGVFVDPSEEELKHAVTISNVDILQFHGSEGPEFISRFSKRAIKAFRVKVESDLKDIQTYDGISACLLDTYVPGRIGGTGETFPWDIALKVKGRKRVILAGGLNPGNVISAVKRVKPYGVDVSGGVEKSPGKKDPHKVRDFIRAAKSAL